MFNCEECVFTLLKCSKASVKCTSLSWCSNLTVSSESFFLVVLKQGAAKRRAPRRDL